MKRADSYFGIPFDFHAGPDCAEVGKNTTVEMIETIPDNVKPDYVQTDCKGRLNTKPVITHYSTTRIL